jgi:hypothetical protein
MTDDTPGAPAASSSASTLAGAPFQAKQTMEGWMGDRGSPYHQGIPPSETSRGMTAEAVQGYYRDLVRGEQAGAADAVPPPNVVDIDLPI